MFIVPTKTKIVATILAKNEEDIIGANIEHHIEQGISSIILTNNGSTDNTKEIASKYKEVIEIIDEPDDTHFQEKWVNNMNQIAYKLNPDWIVHIDADELWCGLGKLRHLKENVIFSKKTLIHPPVPDLKKFDKLKMKNYLEFKGKMEDVTVEWKVAHRPIEGIEILHGNHGVKNYHGSSSQTTAIYRHHYPVRSYEQFERKAVHGYLAMKKRNAVCNRWKSWYETWEEGKLKNLYDQTVLSWTQMIRNPNKTDLDKILKFWTNKEIHEKIMDLAKNEKLPEIKQWPAKK